MLHCASTSSTLRKTVSEARRCGLLGLHAKESSKMSQAAAELELFLEQLTIEELALFAERNGLPRRTEAMKSNIQTLQQWRRRVIDHANLTRVQHPGLFGKLLKDAGIASDEDRAQKLRQRELSLQEATTKAAERASDAADRSAAEAKRANEIARMPDWWARGLAGFAILVAGATWLLPQPIRSLSGSAAQPSPPPASSPSTPAPRSTSAPTPKPTSTPLPTSKP